MNSVETELSPNFEDNLPCLPQISDELNESQVTYYGVFIPLENHIDVEGSVIKVFTDKADALAEVKKSKKARFKAFHCYFEAAEFAMYGSEHANNNSAVNVTSPVKTDSTPTVGEKPSPFRGPKSQDLVKLRKSIENGDIQHVRSTIWENPRYLISNGDTPSILHEGSRYNAMHVAVKANNSEMCDLILSTVGNPNFIQMLYGEENRTNSEEAAKILLDLYLNTPDKGLNETPLHFAVKFGSVEVVETLVSYPQCDKNVLNKFSQAPKDIICSRMNGANSVLIKRIMDLLEDRYYVPVLRSEDNCIQPTIGEPFSPLKPLTLNTNPINPRVEIHAYAGPMKKEDASTFRKTWKTPPRTARSSAAEIFGSPIAKNADLQARAMYHLQDTEKGLERVGRELAKKLHIGWKEYWPFLGTFADLTSKDGLEQLETFLKKCVQTVSTESMTNSRNKCNYMSEGSPIKSLNNSALSPMSELCKNFENCTLIDSSFTKIDLQPTKIMHANYKSDSILDVVPQSELSPYLCVEKACQVFANRMAYHIESDAANISDSLESEIKHLKSLMGSYMDDTRFSNVDFQLVHNRIAHIISYKVREFSTVEDELDDKRNTLGYILHKYDKKVDFFSSDDEELNNYRQPQKSSSRKSTSDSKQVVCLIENVLKYLDCETNDSALSMNTEDDCVKVWNSARTCNCVWKASANKSSRKNSLLKKNNRYSNKNNYIENVSRRLTYYDDEGGEDNKGEMSDKPTQKNNSYYDSSSSSEDEYFTAATSASPSNTESESECFEDPDESNLDVFIEGNVPTKMDYAVFTAVKDLEINQKDYPNVYRWRHAVSLFSDDDQINWPSPSIGHYRIGVGAVTSSYSVPRCNTRSTYHSPLSWLRITGQNSPMKSLRSLRGNSSYGENNYYS